MDFAVDIETMPDLSMIDLLPEVKPSRTLKDPAKIEQDLKEKKEKQIAEMGLDPVFAKVVCICLYNPKEKYTFVGENEEEIIRAFWDRIGNHGNIYTYNGRAFDMDVLLKRGLKYNIGNFATDCMIYRPKHMNGRVIDLMEVFCKYGEYRKLDTLAKIYLGKDKIDIDFNNFPELIKTVEGKAEIGRYCMKDAELTWELAVKFGYDTNF